MNTITTGELNKGQYSFLFTNKIRILSILPPYKFIN